MLLPVKSKMISLFNSLSWLISFISWILLFVRYNSIKFSKLWIPASDFILLSSRLSWFKCFKCSKPSILAILFLLKSSDFNFVSYVRLLILVKKFSSRDNSSKLIKVFSPSMECISLSDNTSTFRFVNSFRLLICFIFKCDKFRCVIVSSDVSVPFFWVD